MIEEIREKGDPSQLKHEDKPVDIKFYCLLAGKGYLYFFENLTENLIGKVNITLDMKNMRIREHPLETRLKIVLNPGEKLFKHVEFKKVLLPWSCNYSYSCQCFENLSA